MFSPVCRFLRPVFHPLRDMRSLLEMRMAPLVEQELAMVGYPLALCCLYMLSLYHGTASLTTLCVDL